MARFIDGPEIEDGLRDLGVAAGDAVEAHASLSAFGHVNGGAPTVVEALTRVVGEDGLLVMSAYRVGPPVHLTEAERGRGMTWKVPILAEDHDEKSGMGAIADNFRRRPDTVVGTGVHRTCAWGREARLHTRGYRRLLRQDGRGLLIGVGIDRCSSMHEAEDAVQIPPDITQLTTPPGDILRDYPERRWAVGYGDTPRDAWKIVWEEAVAAGLVRTRLIGDATCHLFRARAVVDIYEDHLRSDPYALFGVERPDD
ncbi:AAC(3) family N-acetyltransferase [Candidatus Poribacteria bacterium]|mgnify:FL=1|nr:AAC(3) family N-acetyltransferase [Candidatus Poribacteria bacterium]MBT5532392.1 AAC(3) family N-acetyltransferase [Candidatus Poribacteria bacterium]MBT5710402.1 AAC(3) family N-acetyltransferase [Candidatus Poribacteria bacterium]MBT7099504.1 AAC(3) family N-acetyltransferase [Candidatus Poribacteria bacterium]MBT7805303.1 AAC(3) family N-acetyltransferase [Candidatus Poribacteria bacterium]